MKKQWLLTLATLCAIGGVGTGIAIGPSIASAQDPARAASEAGRAAQAGQGGPAGAAGKPAKADIDVAKAVENLDADRFPVREEAMTKLLAAGGPSVGPLTDAILTGSVELVQRGIHVLRELALTGDADTQELARAALERISKDKAPVASRRAKATLTSLSDIRQARAIEDLQRLGARIATSHFFGGQFVENVTLLEIGADWKGDIKDLRRLRWLKGVQQVRFIGGQVTDEWLPFLSSMENLMALTLKRTQVTDAGLANIRGLPKLQQVWLMYSPIGDPAVEHLLTLKQAAQLKLYGTKITREGAKRLTEELVNAKIDHREGAFLGVNCQAHPLGCEVVLVQANTAAATAGLEANDIILRYAGQRVSNFDALTAQISLNKPGDKVPIELARDIRLRREPFVHREGETLGAELKPHVLGCEIVKVTAGSLAERMRLKPGDVIVGYKEDRTADPDALAAVLKAAKAGDEASLDYVRQANVLTRIVTLGEWE